MGELQQRAASFIRSASRTASSPPLSTWSLGIAWAVLLVVLCVRGLRGGATFDFGIFWDAGSAAAAGAPLYDGVTHGRELYLYGPIFAVLMRPFLLLPLEAAYVVWTLASVASVAASAWVTHRALRKLLGPPISGWLLLTGMLILISPLISNFRHGNSNAFLMLLIAVGFWGIVTAAHRGAGIALALAAALKVAPMVFLAWLLVRRSWRATASFLLGLVLWLAILPAMALGPRQAARATLSWGDQVVVPGIVASAERPEIVRAAGHSLTRAVQALLAGGAADEGRPHLELLSPRAARLLATGLAAFILAASLLLGWGERGSGAIGFGVMSAAMLLAAPLSRSAHFMMLYPFVALLLALAIRGDPPLRRISRRGLAAALAAGLSLLLAAAVTGLPSNTFYPLTGLTLALWLTGLRLLTSPQPARPDSATPGSAAA